ncbi:MAG: HEAT repeat domain-containing protein [Simkaniaceae bacterium]|nr:HEAT repeat domain-containing protein [Simkaniaceae bacterium]
MRLIALLLLTASLFALDENSYVERIGAQMIVGDLDSALTDSRLAIALFPDSPALQEMMIRVLSERGESARAYDLFKKRPELDLKRDFFLIESLGWGVLRTGVEASETHELMSLIGAFLTHDHRAVDILIAHLRSSNAMLRAQAARMCAQYRDQALQKEVLRLVEIERNWFVRIELIHAIGKLGCLRAEPKLKEIIASSRVTAEERAAAIQSLVLMTESIEPEQLSQLCSSNRAGLRLLACSLIIHLDLVEEKETIEKLLSDHCPDVRVAALDAVALLDLEVSERVMELLDDPDPNVSVTAAWVLCGSNEASEKLIYWMNYGYPEIARFAASVVAMSGDAGAQIAKEYIKKAPDQLVRANLAIGLLRANTEVKLAQFELEKLLMDEELEIMFAQMHNPMVSTLEQNLHRHVPHLPNYPQIMDNLTRLELINMLCMTDSYRGKELLKQFLGTRMWTVIGQAASIVLSEGDIEGIEMVRELLDDPDEKIATQAALVLAFIGKEDCVIEFLQSAYARAPWEMKVNILEALGHLSSEKAVPFLLDRLDEPFRLIRIVAASSLIQCLYH